MTTLAHELELWEDVEAKLLRTVGCHRGNPLTERDSRTYATALALFGCLLTDLRKRYGSIGPEREVIALIHNLYKLDTSVLGSFLSDAITVVRNVSEPTTMSWFKRQLSDYPVGMIVAPYRGLLENYLQHPSAEAFQPLNQILSFLTRLSLEDIVLDLETEYEDLEERLHNQQLPMGLLLHLKKIIHEWLEDFRINPDTFDPHHGPGAVAGYPRALTIENKYGLIGTDQLLDYALRKAGVTPDIFPYPPARVMRTAEIVVVAKSLKTKRVISKEPAGLAYIQQGVKDQVYDYVDRHPYLRSHLNFSDQIRNGRMAMLGSKNQSYSTIDLSSASDCVTLQMVKMLFRGTRLYPFLIATRSNKVSWPSGTVIDIAKFAPMGSALCFPVESLIFAACVEYAVRRARTGLGDFPNWSVFGDDIVVETPLYEDVTLILEALGFSVNRSKSYTSPARFRESCGIEAYDGSNVCPLRISRGFKATKRGQLRRHAALYQALQEFANQAYFHGFTTTRNYLLRMIFDGGRITPLFSMDNPSALFSVMADNYRAAKRFNKSLFRTELRVDVVRSIPKEIRYPSFDERGRLYETLRLATFHRSTDDMFSPDHLIEVPRCTLGPSVVRTWVNTQTI